MVLPPWKEDLGLAEMSYVVIDYLRHISPAWHTRLQPALWSVLALAYRHWSSELRSALPFIASLLFMLEAFLVEMLSVRFSTTSSASTGMENVGEYRGEYRPEWGSMSFLADILRPTASAGSSWFSLLKKASGSCNDLLYSGHMVVAVRTAMAWTEAYGGWSSAFIWLLVLHSGQREIRERHHYNVDCVVAIYVGIFLWRVSRFLWSTKDSSKIKRLTKFEQM